MGLSFYDPVVVKFGLAISFVIRASFTFWSTEGSPPFFISHGFCGPACLLCVYTFGRGVLLICILLHFYIRSAVRYPGISVCCIRLLLYCVV